MKWCNPSGTYNALYDNEAYPVETQWNTSKADKRGCTKCNCSKCSCKAYDNAEDCYGQCNYYDRRNDYNPTNRCSCCEKNGHRPNEVVAIQIQLEGQQIVQINAEQNVLFDKVITNPMTGIKYDRYTGKVYVGVPGTYYVEWWVAADGIVGGSDVFLEFSVVTSQGKKVRATNPNVSGQISGMAILNIEQVSVGGVAIQLKNTTDGTIGLGNVPVKAGLSVIRLES